MIYYIRLQPNTTNIQDIPIPPVTVPCKYKCCVRTFVPLELSFALTIHKFQGLQAGPVDSGKAPNVFQTIICDPDTKAAEARATGLLYTAVSRATTLGNDNGLNSAIYFTGHNLSHERVVRINYKTNTDVQLSNVQRRSQWITTLKSNIIQPPDNNKKFNENKTWMSHTIPYEMLYTRAQIYVQALSLHQN